MGFYLQIDRGEPEQLGSNSGWNDVTRWAAQIPPGDAPDLHHLCLFGWDNAPANVSDQAKAAMTSYPPTADVKSTLDNLVSLLAVAGKAEIASVTDGFGSDDPIKEKHKMSNFSGREVVTFASPETLATEGAFIDGPWTVYPNSILFKAGDYPDKKFSMSAVELFAQCEAHKPGTRGNIEHTDFLSGRATETRKLWIDADGETLRGAVAIPTDLDGLLLPSERRLSAEFDTVTKEFLGLALTTSPRVKEAALMTAFTNFARHDTPHGQQRIQELHDVAARGGAVCNAPAKMGSRHEATAIQKIHDTTIEAGAACPTLAGANRAPSCISQYARKGEKDKNMPSKLDELKTFFRDLFGVEEPAAAGMDKALLSDPKIAALEMQIAARDIKDRARDAEAFADGVIRANKAMPAERMAIVAAFTYAASDDALSPTKVTFGKDKAGVPLTGSRIDALTALYAMRPTHALDQESLRIALESGETVALLSSKAKADDPDAEKEMDESRRKTLMSKTPVGRATLAAEKSTAGK